MGWARGKSKNSHLFQKLLQFAGQEMVIVRTRVGNNGEGEMWALWGSILQVEQTGLVGRLHSDDDGKQGIWNNFRFLNFL